ncbi:MAG: 3-phosphoshikimate 1-carboxyvinyltransferase [Verrucomicrobiota bacterium]
MKFRCRESRLQGDVRMPGSKSHTVRAVTIAAFANGTSIIRQPLLSTDTESARCAVRALGAEIEITDESWRVQGTGGEIKPKQQCLDLGNSGTSMRILMGFAALIPTGDKIILDGDAQLRKRPAEPLLKALNELGAKARSIHENECPPFEIQGRLQGGKTVVEAFSSQYLTSLLLACPMADNDTSIEVPVLYESQYIDMTLDWLRYTGIKIEQENKKRFQIPGGQTYQSFDRTIPADFSSASFFFGAAAIGANCITCQGLDMNDSQGDKAVLDYLRRMGADVQVDNDSIRVAGGNLQGIDIDMNETPDALPVMAVVGCFAEGATRLRNVAQARIKETDRIAVMAKELRKLGAQVEEQEDGLTVYKSDLKAARVDGHNDHRIVMALAVAGLCIPGTTEITGAQAAAVTFPDFDTLMREIGGRIEALT